MYLFYSLLIILFITLSSLLIVYYINRMHSTVKQHTETMNIHQNTLELKHKLRA